MGALACLVISSAGNLVVPWLNRIIIDRGINQRLANVILQCTLAILVVSVINAFLGFFRGYLSAKTAHGVAYELRNALYAHVQTLSFSFHDRAKTGQLLTRAISDISLMQTFVGTGLLQLISALIMMTGSLILLVRIHAVLTLVVMIVMLLVLFIFAFFARLGRPLFEQIQQRLGRLNTVLQENLTGVRVVQAFVRQPYEIEQFGESNLALREANLRAGRIFAAAMPMFMGIANVGTLAVLWSGGRQVIFGQLSVGELVAFQSYLMMAIFPLMMLGMILIGVSQASAGARRVYELLDTRRQVEDLPDAPEMPIITGRVQFDDVTFQYPGSEEPILKSVSFAAEPGEMVAVVGATGSGKSTLASLIPRFYDPIHGRVLIDGIDVRSVKLESLRRQIGVIFQESTLFTGTIAQNITFGRFEAQEQEIIAVAKDAGAHAFITAFPDGYNTAVGERGATLSGGQKQRIAIARALLIDPRILILDDCTSMVDVETEFSIHQALENQFGDRTHVVIAQRISTVRNADRILVLENGKIADQGSHEELLKRCALYAELCESQLAPREENADEG